MTKTIITVAVLFAFVAPVAGDGINNPIAADMIGPDGINNTHSSGPPPVACGAVGLDFTDACGTTQYMLGL